MLLNGHGEPCAAGAVCLALGIPAKELQGRYDLPIPATASPIRRLWEDDFETTFGLINDAEWLTDTQREAELIEAAAPYGVAFNFVA